MLLDLHIEVFNNKEYEDINPELIYDLHIDIKRMVWLPNFNITLIASLPLNSIFFLIEEGGVMLDEKLYILLRSSGLISVGSKQKRIDLVDDDDHDPLIEEQNVSFSFFLFLSLSYSYSYSNLHFICLFE